MLSVLKECVNKKASGAEATIPDSEMCDPAARLCIYV
jgi:hypothetical protein